MKIQKVCGIINFETGENIYYNNGKTAYYYKNDFVYTTQMGEGYLFEGIKRINMISGEEENLIDIMNKEDFYEQVRFSKDDQNLVALERSNKRIDIYDLESKELKKTFTCEDGFIDNFDFVNNYLYINIIKRVKSDSYEIENYIIKEKI